MKNNINKLILVLTVGLFLNACDKNDIPEVAEILDTDQVAQAKFFFHADDAPSANFFINNEKVSAIGSNTDDEEQGSDYKRVFPSNAYAVVPSGSVAISAMALGGGEIAAAQATLAPGKNYSVYLVGNEGSYEVFTMEDMLPSSDNSKIYWRFVNTMAEIPFSVDAYAVRAAVPATDDTTAEDAMVIPLGMDFNFKEGGDYVELIPGRYTFKIFNSTMDYDPLTSSSFLSHTLTVGSLGRIYTTQIRGTYSDPIGSGKIDYWRDR